MRKHPGGCGLKIKYEYKRLRCCMAVFVGNVLRFLVVFYFQMSFIVVVACFIWLVLLWIKYKKFIYKFYVARRQINIFRDVNINTITIAIHSHSHTHTFICEYNKYKRTKII